MHTAKLIRALQLIQIRRRPKPDFLINLISGGARINFAVRVLLNNPNPEPRT